jgi:transcriptional regulator with XRE-family HTH domain
MNSVGQILRSARESQGRAMAEIADELCITQRYLRALESDDLSNLPGTFFYKSFVRQYAAILGVPIKKLQPGLDAVAGDETPTPMPNEGLTHRGPAMMTRPRTAPVRVLDPLVEASNRYFAHGKIGVPIAALAGVLAVCSTFYGWWNRPPSQAPAIHVERVGQPVSQQIPEAGVNVTTTPDGVKHVVLNLSATESTWLSITSEGKQIFSGILEPSQTKTLTTTDAAQMTIGNAAGVAVRMNGKDVGPLGGRGQVRKVRFTAPDKVEIVEPQNPVAPVGAPL